MPIIKVINNFYMDEQALMNVINYVRKGPLEGGYAIDPEYAFEQMSFVKAVYQKTSGVQLKHFIISFSQYEFLRMDLDEILDIGFNVGKTFNEYQMLYCIHMDTRNIHLHFVMNTVSFIDGHKYSDGSGCFFKVQNMLKKKYPKFDTFLFFSDT